MSVDLSVPPVKSTETEFGGGGIVKFRNGMEFYSWFVGPDEDGDCVVRWEDGRYPGYTKDGLCCELVEVDGKKRWVRDPSAGEDEWDVISFEPCYGKEAEARGVPMTFNDAYRKMWDESQKPC